MRMASLVGNPKSWRRGGRVGGRGGGRGGNGGGRGGGNGGNNGGRGGGNGGGRGGWNGGNGGGERRRRWRGGGRRDSGGSGRGGGYRSNWPRREYHGQQRNRRVSIFAQTEARIEQFVGQWLALDRDEQDTINAHVDAVVRECVDASFPAQEQEVAAQYNEARHAASLTLHEAITSAHGLDQSDGTTASFLAAPANTRLVEAFKNALAPDITLPNKLLAPQSTLRKFARFVQGCTVRFSEATIWKRVEGRMRQEFLSTARSSEEVRAIRNAVGSRKTALIDKNIALLSRSDHVPIRVSASLGKKSGSGDGLRRVQVSSFNVQEFVVHGLSTYIASFPAIRNTRGTGKSKILLDAMLSRAVIERHVVDCVKFVERELTGGSGAGAGAGEAETCYRHKPSAAVCLQETDPRLVHALRERAAQADPPLFYVHACDAYSEGGVVEHGGIKCSSITCIVATEPFHRILPDIVVVVGSEDKNKKSYTRRFAAAVLKGGHTTVVSVHVRHDKGGKTKKNAGGEEQQRIDQQRRRKKRKYHYSGGSQSFNEAHIRQAEDAVLTSCREWLLGDDRGVVIAVGDYNGPMRAPYAVSEEDVGDGILRCRVAPAQSTQYGNPLPVDGGVLLFPREEGGQWTWKASAVPLPLASTPP